MEASRIELPTRTTMPPRIVGSTCVVSSTLRPVWRPISSPMRSTDGVVELDGAGDGDRAGACSPRATAARTRGADRGRRPACGGSRRSSSRKFIVTGSASGDRACAARRSSPRWRSTARRRTARSSAFSSKRVGELTELLADDVELALLLGDLEQRARVDLGDLLHRRQFRRSAPVRAEKSSSPSASSTRRFWSSSVSDLARDLLGRQDREVGDLAADLLDRAARLGLDVLARLLEQLLALACAPGPASRARTPRRSCARAATMSSACARASLSRSRYSASSSSASVLGLLGRRRSTPRSICARLSSASSIAGNANLLRTKSVTTKASSVQIISPTFGLTRKLLLSSAAAAAASGRTVPSIV